MERDNAVASIDSLKRLAVISGLGVLLSVPCEHVTFRFVKRRFSRLDSDGYCSHVIEDVALRLQASVLGYATSFAIDGDDQVVTVYPLAKVFHGDVKLLLHGDFADV